MEIFGTMTLSSLFSLVVTLAVGRLLVRGQLQSSSSHAGAGMAALYQIASFSGFTFCIRPYGAFGGAAL